MAHAAPKSGLFDARGQERAAQFAHLGVELRDAYGDREDGQGVVDSGEVDHEERGQDDDDQRRHRPHPDQLGQAVACDHAGQRPRDAERRLAHLFAVTGAAEERDVDRDDGPQQMRRADQVPMGDREGEGNAQLPRDAASEALS